MYFPNKKRGIGFEENYIPLEIGTSIAGSVA